MSKKERRPKLKSRRNGLRKRGKRRGQERVPEQRDPVSSRAAELPELGHGGGGGGAGGEIGLLSLVSAI